MWQSERDSRRRASSAAPGDATIRCRRAICAQLHDSEIGIDAACPGLADAKSRAFPLEAAAAMSESVKGFG